MKLISNLKLMMSAIPVKVSKNFTPAALSVVFGLSTLLQVSGTLAAPPSRSEDGELIFSESGNAGAVRVTINKYKASANAPISMICIYLPYGGIYPSMNKIIVRDRVAYLVLVPGQSGLEYVAEECYKISDKNVRTINMSEQYVLGTYIPEISKIYIGGGSLYLSEDMMASGTPLIVSFQVALEKLNEFSTGIKRSDQRHVTRLKQALQGALKEIMGESGTMKLPVVHMKVMEHSRLIMVLATVLNELLVEYEDVENLKVPVEYLKSFATQIRNSYGWNEGLAGGASKSLAALGTVIDLETRELYYTMGAAGVTDISPINKLLAVTQILSRQVKATNSGDASAKLAMEQFANTWNSAPVQEILSKLMNAPADVAGLVQPKLKLLFTAIESLSDLTDTRLSIPADFPGKPAIERKN
jgi:hypothetical protein